MKSKIPSMVKEAPIILNVVICSPRNIIAQIMVTSGELAQITVPPLPWVLLRVFSKYYGKLIGSF
jgi:uncharacterized membrane protein